MKIVYTLILLIFLAAGTASGTAGKPGLPKGINWVTNSNPMPFASSKAQRGGVLKTYTKSYPLTFRLFGPNSNDSFASWNRDNCFFTLVTRHPNTLEDIPELATHWAVMKDQKTIYFKLDPDVRFSDGRKVTADNYVFAYQMMLSKHIKDPFYNKVYAERFESVERIDDYTLKITGTYPSWRALHDFQINPEASHAIVLDENWVKRDNWKKPVCVGPYVISKVKRGRYVNFQRLNNWWGDKKKYLRNRYNFERINIKVIRDRKIAFEHFKKGNLSFFQVQTASRWAKETGIRAVRNGWIVQRRVFVKSPQGKYGIVMNYRTPLFQNKNFRKALQHLFDFDKINKNLMYNAYVRVNSFWGGTEYEKKDLHSYPYSPKKAAEYLKKAGWTGRGPDGILRNARGERCSFILTYGSQGLTRHLTVFVEDLKEAGVEMKLRLVDGAKAFKDGLDKNFQALLFGRVGGIYPSPEQYLHSDYAKTKNNNNVFSFADPEVDRLIDIYSKNLNFRQRLEATHRIEEIVKDEAFYIPFWDGPYVRMLFWNNLGYTDQMEPLYSSVFNDYQTYWYDSEQDKLLQTAKKRKTVIPHVNSQVDFDPHELRR